MDSETTTSGRWRHMQAYEARPKLGEPPRCDECNRVLLSGARVHDSTSLRSMTNTTRCRACGKRYEEGQRELVKACAAWAFTEGGAQ